MRFRRARSQAASAGAALWAKAEGFLRTHPRFKAAFQDAFIYSIALGIIGYLASNIALSRIWRDFTSADLPALLAAAIGGFLLWFLGETFLFSKLFSFFHARTTFRETMPALATMYFLQVVNSLLAQAALVVFLHNRKQARWGAAVMTLAFQGFIDFFALTTIALTIGLVAPQSLARPLLPYTSLALAGGVGAALWVRWRRRPTPLERLLLDPPSLATFRSARFHHYAVLYAIRIGIMAPYALFYFAESRAFHLRVPLAQVFALTPLLIASSSVPLTPNGLGVAQSLTVRSFAAYAPPAQVLAFSLTASALYLICCALLGLTSARHFAQRIILSEGRYQEPSHGLERV